MTAHNRSSTSLKLENDNCCGLTITSFYLNQNISCRFKASLMSEYRMVTLSSLLTDVLYGFQARGSSPLESSMPDDQANEIRAVMANISLQNIPSWAQRIPEEQWMTKLITDIQRTQTVTTGVKTPKTDSDTNSSSPTDAAPEFVADFEKHFSSNQSSNSM